MLAPIAIAYASTLFRDKIAAIFNWQDFQAIRWIGNECWIESANAR